jgi:hydroxymethylpyrimidine/phosphomethylpyrimidine kinase
MDLKTFQAHSIYACSVITAIVAQNTRRVLNVFSLPTREVEKQLDAVLSDFKISHVKIGMHGADENFALFARKLKGKKMIYDPVMSAQSDGTKFVNAKTIRAMKGFLKNVYLITPNVAEAETLSGIKIRNEENAIAAAQKITDLGAKNILIKGLAKKSAISDYLFTDNKIYEFSKPLARKGTHGGGCAFASAITANLAKGKNLVRAVGDAEVFIQGAIERAKKLGKGIEIVQP